MSSADDPNSGTSAPDPAEDARPCQAKAKRRAPGQGVPDAKKEAAKPAPKAPSAPVPLEVDLGSFQAGFARKGKGKGTAKKEQGASTASKEQSEAETSKAESAKEVAQDSESGKAEAGEDGDKGKEKADESSEAAADESKIDAEAGKAKAVAFAQDLAKAVNQEQDLSDMPISRLKEIASDHGVSFSGLIEKSDMVKALQGAGVDSTSIAKKAKEKEMPAKKKRRRDWKPAFGATPYVPALASLAAPPPMTLPTPKTSAPIPKVAAPVPGAPSPAPVIFEAPKPKTMARPGVPGIVRTFDTSGGEDDEICWSF
eukprot:CAMPEP_0178424582 /NCGR_PEP_ID=MMETSP0689_2-20121128/28283_1 /TAXON_ID=160604 /ORGANISM="Amphidinium massartii, Strain CS-259" /LENGTH=312 /DNA_ID=CAMNT_0020046221 /DNA_START=53 /DNA_END=988 /DNA_ORIENTATION=+